MLLGVCFKIAAPNTFKNIQKAVEVEFHFNKNARLQSPAYYWTESSTTDTFLKLLRK